MKKKSVALILFVALGMLVPSQASAYVESLRPAAAETAKTVGEAMMAEPAQLKSASLPEYPYDESEPIPGEGYPYPTGIGGSAPPPPGSLTGFPTQGNTYGILSSGDVKTVGTELENNSPNTTTEYEFQVGEKSARGPAAEDWTVLRLGVEVPSGDNCLALDYRFLSEEFPEFVGSVFNDAFIAELESSSWSVAEGGELTRPNDFAASTAGKPISVNGVGPTAVSPTEAEGTYFDAATGLITTKTPITPGLHSIYLSIFDSSDKLYDSAVFLDNLRFINESPETCRPPVGAELTVPPPGAPPSNSFSVGPHVKFKNGGTQATIIVTVPGPGIVAASQPPTASSSSATSATASRLPLKGKRGKRLLKPATVHVSQAGPVKLTVKLTGAAKKILAHKRKLNVPLEITFTPDGGSPASKDMSLTFKKPGKHRKGKKHG